MQADMQHDLIYDCTIAVILEYCSWVWESRGSLGKVQSAWTQLKPNTDNNPTRAVARGSLGAVWLSLLRIGWDMQSAHILRSDDGRSISLLQFAPQDINILIQQGVDNQK